MFVNDEAQTRHAQVLHVTLWALLGFLGAGLIANWIGGRAASSTLTIEGVTAGLSLGLLYLLRRGRVHLISAATLLLGFSAITFGVAALGTIRTPTTALYLGLIAIAGLLLDLPGILALTAASSLAVAGLIVAENAHGLPAPDYAVTITQWVAYTALFGFVSGLSYWSYHALRRALARADQEINERKRMEHELRKLARVVEYSPAAIVITNLAGEIEYVNPKFTQITGYTLAEAVSQNPCLLKSGRTTDEESTQLWETITAGGEWRGEFLNTKKSGERYWEAATIAPIGDEHGLITHFVAIKEDITARKQTEEALRESEDRYRQMFEQNQAVQLLIDPDTGQILRANGAAARFYGYSITTLQQLHINDLNQLDPAQTTAEMRLAKSQQRAYFIFPHRLASGEVRQVEVHSSPITLAGRPVLYSIVHDITDRLRAEARLRRFWDLPLVGMAITSPDRRFLEVNQKLADMLGYAPEELTGLTWVEVTHPADVAENIRLLAQVVAGTTDEYAMDKRFIRRDGTLVYTHIAARCIRRDNGTVDHLALLIQDVTARQQAEDGQRRSETLLRTLIDALPERIFAKDTAGRFTLANATEIRLNGTASFDELRGKTDFDCYPIELARQYHATEQLVLIEGRTLIGCEEQSIERDGQPSWHLSTKTPLRDVDNHIIGLVGMTMDITDRKRMEAALRESEARFRAMIEQSSEGIMLLDEHATIIEWNPAQAQITGISQAEALGQPAWEIQIRQAPIGRRTPAMADYIKQTLIDLLATGQSPLLARPVEGVIETTPGEQRHVVQNSFLIKTEQGYRLGAIVHDLTTRKRMEDALRQSEEQLRAVIANNLDGMVVVDEAGLVCFSNPAAVALLSRPLTDLIGRPFGLPVDAVESTEIDLLQPDGETRTVDMRASNFLWSNQPAFLVSLHDTTVRKRMEDALRASEAKFRAIIQESSEGILLVDERGLVVEWNRGHEQITGITQAAAVGQPIWEIQYRQVTTARRPLLSIDALKRNVQHLLATGQSPQFHRPVEVPIETPSGEVRILMQNAFPIKTDHGYRLGVIFHDVTAQKQAEAAVRRQFDFLAALHDTALDLLNRRQINDLLQTVVDRAAVILDAPYGELMLIEGDELVVHAATDNQPFLKGERARRAVAALSWQAHDTRQPAILDDYSTWPRRRTIYDAVALRAVADFPIMVGPECLGVLALGRTQPDRPFTPEDIQQGRLFSQLAALVLDNANLYASALRDLTERARAEAALRDLNATLEQRVTDRTAELQAANDRLTELDHLKDAFISRISHELRTPLTGILIALELLETAAPEKRERFMLRLKQSADRLRAMIEDVLMFSQLNLNTAPALLASIDLNNLIEGRLTTWEKLSAGHDLQFRLNLMPNLPPVSTDSDLIMQVLARLIANAASYTPAGSVIVSTAHRDEGDRRWVTISVKDTGPGITSGELPHIFERFYRGRAAADYKTPGTGVGLSISREIMDRLGGRLTVETRAGVGSTFTIWLPATN